MSDSTLDGIVKDITDDVWSQIDCLKCANCCKVLQPSVDAADIKRLAKRLGITPKQFEERYVAPEPDEFGDTVLKTMPCVFLGQENKCTVYEDRPKACRDYPYLYKKDFRTRTMSMISNTEVCPIVFNVWQRLKARFWPPRNRKTLRL
jgi:hypothetical protein